MLGYERETFRRETVISATSPRARSTRRADLRVHIEPHGELDDRPRRRHGDARRGRRRAPSRSHRETAEQARPNMRAEPRAVAGRGAAPRVRLGAAEGDVPAQPRRPRRAALLAARSPAGGACPPPGLPWFMTMFGRDSIFTSLQALPFTPELAATTLRVLGDWQGSRVDDFRDEDPGRILHEMRYGEMTAFEERPHSPVLRLRRRDAAVRRAARRVRALDRRHASSSATSSTRRARRSNWIDEYADLLGNGYVSYQRRNEETGLENQCWKDSWDSISYRDGRLPGFPRATCELQGYAYDAKMRGARLARHDLEGPGVRRPARDRGRRPQAPLQPRLLGRGRRVLRARPRRRRQPGRRADVEQRPPALERHRRQVEGEGRRAPPHGPAAVLRLGRAHAGRGRGPLQPDRLPRRHRLAVRQLVHRLGPAPLRLQGGGGADRRRASSTPPSSSTGGCPRRSAATQRTLTKYPVQYPTACSPQAWSTGHAAAAAADDARPRADRRPPRRRPGAPAAGSATSSCSTSPAAGDGSTPSGGGGSRSTDERGSRRQLGLVEEIMPKQGRRARTTT